MESKIKYYLNIDHPYEGGNKESLKEILDYWESSLTNQFVSMLKGSDEKFTLIHKLLHDAGIHHKLFIVLNDFTSGSSGGLQLTNTNRNAIWAEYQTGDKIIVSYLNIGEMVFYIREDLDMNHSESWHVHKSAKIPLLDFETIEKSFYIEAFLKWVKKNL